MNGHCEDLNGDRSLGAFWENQFARIALEYGHVFTPHQHGHINGTACAHGPQRKRLILPDFTIWSGDGEHHEVKHKEPTTKWREYGLELYRLESLREFAWITQEKVYYTIHNHERAGGRNNTENRIEDWVFASIDFLDGIERRQKGQSWVGGKPTEVTICYWPMIYFAPLENLWKKTGDLYSSIKTRKPAKRADTSSPDQQFLPFEKELDK